MIWSPSTSARRRVHGQATVGVAIQCDPEVGSSFEHGRLEVLQVRGAVSVVDVEPVGLASDARPLGAGLTEGLGAQPRWQPRARSPTTHVQAVQRCGSTPSRCATYRAGPSSSGRTRPTVAPVGRSRARPAVPRCASSSSSAACGPRGEELDAVVRHRVVGRREHDARGRRRARRSGTRWPAWAARRVQDVDPARRQPRDGRRVRNSPRPGGPGQTIGRGRWPLKAPTSPSTWAAATDRSECELSGQILVREATDAIGAEESSSHAG
jgi:hypothetical protein